MLDVAMILCLLLPCGLPGSTCDIEATGPSGLAAGTSGEGADMVQVLVTALSQAAVLAPMALGVALLFRIAGVINFAAGTVCVAAGFVYVEAGGGVFGLVVALAAGGALGVMTFVVAVLPGKVRGIAPVGMTVSTLGFALVLQAVVDEVFGTSPRTAEPWSSGSVQVIGTSVSVHRLLSIAVVGVVVLLVVRLFDRTVVGRGMEACSCDEPLAQLYGLRTHGFHVLAWFVAGACCALSGSVQSGLASVSGGVAMPLLITALVAAVLGGIGSLAASAVGAAAVSLMSAIVQQVVPVQIPLTPIFALLLVGLALRPDGLFTAAKTGERV